MPPPYNAVKGVIDSEKQGGNFLLPIFAVFAQRGCKVIPEKEGVVVEMNASLEKQGIGFSVRVAELVKYLREDARCFPLSGELLTCAVDAGLAIRDDRRQVAATLVARTNFIIEMAVVAGYLTPQQSVHLRADCEGLLAALQDTQEHQTRCNA